MTDEAFVVPVAEAPRRRTRMRHALRQRANWLQLLRFAAVGASGYVVNLAVFAAAVHGAGFDYLIAAAMAFAIALANNFFWNRGWTFRAGSGHAGFQAARFLVVSLVAFGFNVVLLFALVEYASMPKVAAQALAIAAATPLNFIGNKLWSFKT
ncbi:MAG TPA: GtrA family protein [Solirubrobacteraceae bacterium]|jgi:dolichol-phosphate mannosyltransferase|nr:GtrA family protein [Solirubrobacteraceae bacterium]